MGTPAITEILHTLKQAELNTRLLPGPCRADVCDVFWTVAAVELCTTLPLRLHAGVLHLPTPYGAADLL